MKKNKTSVSSVQKYLRDELSTRGITEINNKSINFSSLTELAKEYIEKCEPSIEVCERLEKFLRENGRGLHGSKNSNKVISLRSDLVCRLRAVGVYGFGGTNIANCSNNDLYQSALDNLNLSDNMKHKIIRVFKIQGYKSLPCYTI